jgi:hypothetical protein
MTTLLALLAGIAIGWSAKRRYTADLRKQAEDAKWDRDSAKARLDQDRERRLAAVGSSVRILREDNNDDDRWEPTPPPTWARKTRDPLPVEKARRAPYELWSADMYFDLGELKPLPEPETVR